MSSIKLILIVITGKICQFGDHILIMFWQTLFLLKGSYPTTPTASGAWCGICQRGGKQNFAFMSDYIHTKNKGYQKSGPRRPPKSPRGGATLHVPPLPLHLCTAPPLKEIQNWRNLKFRGLKRAKRVGAKRIYAFYMVFLETLLNMLLEKLISHTAK